MTSFNTTPSAPNAAATTSYTHFVQLVAELAQQHQPYLDSRGLGIADCYQLTFNYAKARFQVTPTLPVSLHEALRQCFITSFGQ